MICKCLVRDMDDRKKIPPEAESAVKRDAEAELLRAREAAEQATRAKNEFLAIVSHELRTPITVVLGMLELIREHGDFPPELNRYLQMAHSSSESLFLLIEDLLDLSRIERGEVELSEELFNLPRCIRESAEPLAADAAEKGIDFSLSLAPDLPTRVSGDPGKLRQVLSNLAGNAIKFTSEGKVEILVSPLPSEADKIPVRFEVRDTGIGIPLEKIDRLFEKFTQADSSLTRRFGGAGLGLAISRGIIERMGGEIRAESLEGRGSVFFFTIPFSPAERRDASSPSLPKKAAVPPRPGRILIVEDEPMIAQMIKIMLESRGWEARVARDGREGLEALEEETFGLVFMDVQMPGLDGLEMTRRIRKREGPEGNHMPIIALTAHARPEDRQECLDAGMDDYLPKPVRMPQLYAAVEKHLPRRES